MSFAFDKAHKDLSLAFKDLVHIIEEEEVEISFKVTIRKGKAHVEENEKQKGRAPRNLTTYVVDLNNVIVFVKLSQCCIRQVLF